MTFSRARDFADERTTIGDNCILKRFDFYMRFKRLKYSIIYAAPQQNNVAFDHTDNGDQLCNRF